MAGCTKRPRGPHAAQVHRV